MCVTDVSINVCHTIGVEAGGCLGCEKSRLQTPWQLEAVFRFLHTHTAAKGLQRLDKHRRREGSTGTPPRT